MKPNFSGMATKYGVLCTDGRTILADAFKHQDKQRLPLLWRHDDDNPSNILGHVILEHEDGVGVRVTGYFNTTPNGQHTRGVVEHGDIRDLSIKAVRLRQNGTNVVGGQLTEVSLVPHGANSEARIEDVYIQHGDGMVSEAENQGIIFSGESFLIHEDSDEDVEDDDVEHDEEEGDGPNVQEVFDSFTPEQLAVVELLLSEAVGSDAEHEDSDESDNLNHEGENEMTRNVFDKTADDKAPKGGQTLTHEQQGEILAAAAKHGSLRGYFESLQHDGMAAPYGITNIEDLFPEFKNVQNRPEWIKRDTEWVAGVLSAVRSVPFTRIKSRSADITHEEARAKGYIKGNLKKRQFFAISSRTTESKTIYKAQGFDRDDLIDLDDFGTVAWVKEEMKGQLREEIARAILIGDNRAEEDPANPGSPNPDKIDEDRIRPVATDDDFYTAKMKLGVGQTAKDLAEIILRSRKLIKGGTGRPTLYTTTDLVVDLLLQKDQLGRRYYETTDALAAALGVAKIEEVEVMEDDYRNEDGDRLIAVMVNLNDYDFGANSMGGETMFEDFDIDYNQYKYLIETRRAGALTKYRSAVSLWESDGIEVAPVAPSLEVDELTLTATTGVEYWKTEGLNDPVKIVGTTLTLTPDVTYQIEARPATGYRFPFNVTTYWTFTYTA